MFVCPTCQAAIGKPCRYVGTLPRRGNLTRNVHSYRRNLARRARQHPGIPPAEFYQPEFPVPSAEIRSAAQALRDFDLEEHRKLHGWLRRYGRILVDV